MQIVKSAIRKVFHLVGLEVHRKNPGHSGNLMHSPVNAQPNGEANLVMPDIWDRQVFQGLIASALPVSEHHIVLLGSRKEINYLTPIFVKRGQSVTGIKWGWGEAVGSLPGESQIIVCKVPVNERQWWSIKKLKSQYGSSVITLQELVLRFTTLQLAQSRLDYLRKTLEDAVPLYTGESYSRVDLVNSVFPLAGKTVIEFGPMDGSQTAGLVHLGAKSVTCIEARAENAIKTLVAQYGFGWNNVQIIMDDFHNADVIKYGTYDLAFANGVYYHSVAPFLFLENLLSLSGNIYVGGFCATETLPQGEYETLEHNGKKYRVKKYQEGDCYAAGVNTTSYYFHGDDLLDFFGESGCQVHILADEQRNIAAGRYLCFLATKQ